MLIGLTGLVWRCTPGVSSSGPLLQIEAKDPGLSFANGLRLFNNQPFTGAVVEYDDRHKLRAKEAFQYGKQEGVSQQWYANGQLAESRFYADNRKTGRHQGWWPNGARRFDYTFDNGIPVGHHQRWFENGQPFCSFHYDAEGHEEGTQTMWYENGKIKANFTVRNGRRFGLLGAKGCAGK